MHDSKEKQASPNLMRKEGSTEVALDNVKGLLITEVTFLNGYILAFSSNNWKDTMCWLILEWCSTLNITGCNTC